MGAGKDEDIAGFLDFAATIIQKHFRGYKERVKFQSKKESAQTIQAFWRGHDELAILKELAAVVIQRWYRRSTYRRTFAYYKNLITFRAGCDAKEVMRFVNPREASLIDAAAGVHVRFRLGGSCFPPIVFYKIFTHRPVLDVCSFCPRNYAGERGAAPAALWNHAAAGRARRDPVAREDFELPQALREYVLPDGMVRLRDVRGWYQRQENNGWRPIAERVLVDEGAASHCPLKRQPFFHFDASARRAERALTRKARRRQWMLNLYRRGMHEEHDPEKYKLLRDHGMLPDPHAVPEDDLLKWSKGLDFDSYADDWAMIATTLPSEAAVPLNLSADLPGIPAC